MVTDNPATPSPESEPLDFRTLLNRLNSVMHRLKVSADYFDWDDVPEKYESAVFVIQEVPSDLHQIEEELSYWHAVNIERPRKAEAAAQAQPEAPKAVQS